jgi:hypothetical protein
LLRMAPGFHKGFQLLGPKMFKIIGFDLNHIGDRSCVR